MFGFWKKAEKTVDEQVAEVKKSIALLLDSNGNPRPGVTSEQIRSATAALNKLTGKYKEVGALKKANDEMDENFLENRAKVMQNIKDRGQEDLIKDMPITRILLGL